MQYKYAVYPGSIVMDDGSERYFTATEIAALYGITGKPYLTVGEFGPAPFGPGNDEVSYVHLKPRTDNIYQPISDNYKENTNVTYEGLDFDGHNGGKWEQPKVDNEGSVDYDS